MFGSNRNLNFTWPNNYIFIEAFIKLRNFKLFRKAKFDNSFGQKSPKLNITSRLVTVNKFDFIAYLGTISMTIKKHVHVYTAKVLLSKDINRRGALKLNYLCCWHPVAKILV